MGENDGFRTCLGREQTELQCGRVERAQVGALSRVGRIEVGLEIAFTDQQIAAITSRDDRVVRRFIAGDHDRAFGAFDPIPERMLPIAMRDRSPTASAGDRDSRACGPSAGA